MMSLFPNAEYWDGYGMTEAGLLTRCPPSDAARKKTCVGIPYHNSRIRVVRENETDAVPGEIGEVVVQGPQVFKGYYNDTEATAKAIRGEWFYTGDLGTQDDEGYLYLVDRKKDMIISGGENVYSAEVETALFDHPKVLEAAVIGLSDAKWGERVTAVVVLKNDEAVSQEEIIDFCRSKLAHYKCPKQVIFARRNLPRTAAGKVLKRDLRETFQEREA
jgi:acyl-CoA synthetase (AMP-forming)/AMP-acid ligase II